MRDRARVLGFSAIVAALCLAALHDSVLVAPEDRFEVSGTVGGLYPGAVVVFDAEIGNPFNVTIVVTGVRAVASDASPDCSGDLVDVADTTADTVIVAGSTGLVVLTITMDPDAPDACQGVGFPLAFTATAHEFTAAPPSSTTTSTVAAEITTPATTTTRPA